MTKELSKENGALYKEIKRLNFGQFLFLYFFARNTSYTVSCEVLKKLKVRSHSNSETNKTSRNTSSGSPSCKSSSENLECIANAPSENTSEEMNTLKVVSGKRKDNPSPRKAQNGNRQGSIFCYQN